MSRQLLFNWLLAAVARGIAWFIAVKLGGPALEADTFAHAAASALGAILIAACALYDSIRSRHQLLHQSPPVASPTQSTIPGAAQ